MAKHNAIEAYIKREIQKEHQHVDEKPHFYTESGLRKPNLVAKIGDNKAIVLDAQIVGEQVDLREAHMKKIQY